jgi:dCTP deaminase
MILTGQHIRTEVEAGRITIEPFDARCLNPNSYNYHLGPNIKIAPAEVLDPSLEYNWGNMAIPSEGMLLEPGVLYLGHTAEVIGSRDFVTSLIGRSSVGRLGLFLQLSADLGHQGAIHSWTLELAVVQPLIIYAGMRIGQVSFWVPEGIRSLYSGVYANQHLPLENRVAVLNSNVGGAAE